MKTTIVMLSQKEAAVSFTFKDGLCPLLDEAFEKIIEINDKTSFQKSYESSFPPLISENVFIWNIIDNQKTNLELFFQNEKQGQIDKCLMLYNRKELETVKKNMDGKCFYNMTNKVIDTVKAEKWISLGKNFNPHLNRSQLENSFAFSKSIKVIVQKLLLKSENIKIVFDNSDLETQLEKLLYTKPMSNDIQKFIDNLSSNFSDAHSNFLTHIQTKVPIDDSIEPQQLEDIYNIPGYLFLEADKNIGYVLLSNSDILDQYKRINIKQKFTKVNINEREYVLRICKTINSSLSEMPFVLRSIVPYNLLQHVQPRDNHSIGIMRLLPKACIYYPKLNG